MKILSKHVMKKLIYFYIILFSLQSCVPTKKLIYLQDDGSKIKKLESVEYKFKPNDLIYVKITTRDKKMNELFGSNENFNNVSKENLYFRSYTVDKNGYIELPLVGKIYVNGKSAGEIKSAIEHQLLTNYFRNKEDFHIIVKPAGIIVTVLGEVNNPGQINILKENPNVLEAIAQSGEIQLTGNRTDIMIIREKPNGAREIGHIDLTKREALNSPFFHLENNDLIYVKPLPQKTIGTGTTFVNTLSTLMGLTSFIISIYLLTRK